MNDNDFTNASKVAKHIIIHNKITTYNIIIKIPIWKLITTEYACTLEKNIVQFIF